MSQIIIFADKSNEHVHFRRTLGPYRLAHALKEAGYSVQVVDWFSSWNMNQLFYILDQCVGPETLWVGWSSTFMVSTEFIADPRSRMWSRLPAEMDLLFDHIKNRNPKTQLVYGGAYAHLKMHDTRIDHYIWGYADLSVIEFSRQLLDGQTPPRTIDSRQLGEPPIQHLRTDWTDPSYCILPNEALPIEMARGCVFKCRFCDYPLIGKRKGTYQRPVDQLREQIMGAYEAYGTTRYYFTDDTFNDDPDRLKELHAMIKSLPFRLQFSCFLRLDLIGRWPHTADLLVDMGLIGCFFGVETFNKKSGVAVGKGADAGRNKELLRRLHDQWGNQVMTAVGLIVGLPYDTPEYFAELEEWITDPKRPAHNISLNSLWISEKPFEGAGQRDGYSEFALNTEVYGYERTANGWILPSQGLTEQGCRQLRDRLRDLAGRNNYISEFYLQDYLNVGVPIEDIRTIPGSRLALKYDMIERFRRRVGEYQQNLLAYLGAPTK
jgi:Radical SAM superfamily